ncbi:hypothetical protein ACWCSD_32465 [Nonomuraea sp. NPDC001684]
MKPCASDHAATVVVHPVELRPEHHLEVGPVVEAEAEVGDADLPHVGGSVLKSVGEQGEALGGHGRQQTLLVAEW